MTQPVTLRSSTPAPVYQAGASGLTPFDPGVQAPEPPADEGFIHRVQSGLRGLFGLPPLTPQDAPLPPPPPAPRAFVAPPPPAAPVLPATPPPLRLGDRGSRVVELQQLLIELELLNGPPTTVYDRATERAIWDFQQAYVGPDGAQLGVDGVAGQPTLDALRLLKQARKQQQQHGGVEREPTKVAPSYYQVGQIQVLGPSSSGPDVQRAQALLQALGYDVAQTSVYDQATLNAVADFQARYIRMTGRMVETDARIGPATGFAMASSVESMRESPMTWLAFSRQIEEQRAQPAPPPPPDQAPLPPAPAVPYAGAPPLKPGSPDKTQVTALQNQLIQLGYGLAPDGSFGNGTQAALADFQRLFSLFTGEPLTADGTSNDATRAALANAIRDGLMNRLPAPLRHGTIEVGYVRGVPHGIVTRSLGDGGGNQLESRAALAYYAMHETAKRAGATFTANEGFRSYAYQRELANRYRHEPGHAAAPGWSTHQSGIAIDAHGDSDTDNNWLTHHAKDFGFILPGYTYRSGRQWVVETWHREYRVDRVPNAARAFYGLPQLNEDPVPTSPPPSRRRTTRRRR